MERNVNALCLKTKNVSLKILVIHQILVEIEESLLKCRENIEKLRNKYKGTIVEKFTFHTKLTIETPSGISYCFTECSLFSLFDLLEVHLDSYYFCFIEMFDKEMYEDLKIGYFKNPYSVNYSIHPLDNK